MARADRRSAGGGDAAPPGRLSWRAVYLLVLGNLALDVVLLAWLRKAFE